MAGNHTVNQSSAKFSAVWSDMALEQSANCHSKSKVGGTIGITKKTVAQWWITAHERAAICDRTREMLEMKEEFEPEHKEKSKIRQGRD